jgi:tryptophan synthase alpha chain
MSKLQQAFAGQKALMAFVTCGDPSLEVTGQVIRSAVEAGANIIELNIPFSDPTAVDPVIQQANIRALEKGITTDDVFNFVRELRKELDVAMVVSSYANVVFSYGPERFAAACEELGIEGIIIPDVPFEEREEFLAPCRKHNVALICMVAVTSKERVRTIAREAEGFLYIMACPGTREQELTELLALVRENTDTPCLICLTGTEECRMETVAARTDGVAVDVPIVELVEQYGSKAPSAVGIFLSRLKETLS